MKLPAISRLASLAIAALCAAVPVDASSFVTTPPVGNTDNAVYSLAQNCKTLRSPATGKYLNKSGSNFQFGPTDAGQAEPFFMKPTKLGEFLLTDRASQYLTRSGSNNPAAAAPSLAAEWKITATQPSANSFRYRLLNVGTNTPLTNSYSVRQCTFFGLICWNQTQNEEFFELASQPANACAAYPEIVTNVSGDPAVLKGSVSAPVRGYIDAHEHISSFEMLGGNVVHGRPFHKYGVAYALQDSKVVHGENGSLDVIGNLYTYGSPINQYDTRGWPDFPFWPNQKNLTHSGFYYKWLERAWLSGLRMTVSYVSDNEALCQINQTIKFFQPNPNSCRDMDSIRLQVKRLNEMQDYIDAQAGGPGRGFFRLVYSPADARRVIADGKLAVMIGVEISEVLDCGDDANSISGQIGALFGGLFPRDGVCTNTIVDQRLDELYNLGVRAMYVTHKFDNQFGGVILDNTFINIGNEWATGHYFGAKECDKKDFGKQISFELPLVPQLTPILGMLGVAPSYPDKPLCSSRGLTPLGAYLVNRMIDRKMIVDIDHMGEDTRKSVLAILKARQYSGVVSTHSYIQDGKKLDAQGSPVLDGHGHPVPVVNYELADALKLGGFASIYNADVDEGKERIRKYLDIVMTTPYVKGVGLGTDMAGLGGQAGPRKSAEYAPLVYPYTTEFGLAFAKQKSGNRTFDLNSEGVSHYGMLADIVADYRRDAVASGDASIYEAIMSSAESYLQMWERAQANTSTRHYNPL